MNKKAYSNSDFVHKVAMILNSPSWSPSWHWDRTEFGNITEKGAEQMLDDLNREIDYCKRRVEILDEYKEELLKWL